jgi:hypothetical protein
VAFELETVESPEFHKLLGLGPRRFAKRVRRMTGGRADRAEWLTMLALLSLAAPGADEVEADDETLFGRVVELEQALRRRRQVT